MVRLELAGRASLDHHCRHPPLLLGHAEGGAGRGPHGREIRDLAGELAGQDTGLPQVSFVEADGRRGMFEGVGLTVRRGGVTVRRGGVTVRRICYPCNETCEVTILCDSIFIVELLEKRCASFNVIIWKKYYLYICHYIILLHVSL